MRNVRKSDMLRRGLSILTALLLYLSPGMSLYTAAAPAAEKTAEEQTEEEQTEEAEEEIEIKTDFLISSEEDWTAFAEAAHEAEWSKNRTVRLKTDLSFSAETARIMYFAGTFDGEGHTIKGMSIRSEVSDTGLFAQLEEGAAVKNLSLIGAVLPVGRHSVLGGIAGINRGTIENCSWFGSVDAHDEVGGIAGRNEATGVIRGCTAGGIIQGDLSAGGITGFNNGLIEDCRNEAQVNTVYTEVPFSTEDISLKLDEILQTGRITTVENINQKKDLGGIAGGSAGEIRGSVNAGKVGYEHVGHNAGGIVGRSTGLVRNCSNEGEVLGRRDVGGIVGQQQPDLEMSFSAGSLGEIGSALDDLEGLINDALSETENHTNDTSARLLEIAGLIRVAKGDVQTLTGDAANRADEAAARMNAATNALELSLSDIATACSRIFDYVKKVSAAVKSFEEKLRVYLDRIEMTATDRERLKAALERLDKGLAAMSDAADALEKAIGSGPEIPKGGEQQAEAALKKIIAAYADMLEALSDIESILAKYEESEGVSDLAFCRDIEIIEEAAAPIRQGMEGAASGEDEILNVLQEGSAAQEAFLADLTTGNLTDLIARIDEAQAVIHVYTDEADGSSRLSQDLESAKDALRAAGAGEGEIAALESDVARITADAATVDEQLEIMRKVRDEVLIEQGSAYAAQEILPAISGLVRAFSEVSGALSELTAVLRNYFTQISEPETAAAREDCKKAMDELATQLNRLPDIDPLLPDALSRLSNIDLRISGVSSAAREAGSSLYSAIDQMITKSNALNESLKNAASDTVGNLKGINGQMGQLADLIEAAVEEQRNRSLDPADYTDDISEENLESASRGRITGCTNRARVDADADVGGIAGFMGVDLELDPEHEIATAGSRSADARMMEKAIIDSCTNEGEVHCKNNYAGGMVGRMQMGIVYAGRSLGWIEAGGSYAGGIAGFSGAVIKGCLAKTGIRANGYAGGIAGLGSTMTDNRAMVYFRDATQHTGAIAGSVQEISAEKLSGNLWCGGGVWAVDDVDYAGLAERADYDVITQGQGALFKTLRLTFLADDQAVAVLDCRYGDALQENSIPGVPKKEGFIGTWSETDFSEIRQESRIEAVYTRIVTIIASKEKRKDGKPVLFAEGSFAPGDELMIPDSREEDGSEVWFIRLPEGQTGVHRFRFLPDADMGGVSLRLSEDGQLRTLRTGTMGQYLTFEAEGQQIELTVVRQEGLIDRLKSFAMPLAIGAAAVGAVIIAAIVVNRRKKKNQEKDS